MSEEFKLEIITPERVLFSDNVTSLSAYSIEGRMEILYDHRPLLTKLKVAPLTFRQNETENYAAISRPGFLEVAPEKVMVFCDVAELAEEIDKTRAEEAKKRAEERLKAREEKMDNVRAEAALNRAVARINTAKQRENK